MHHPPTDRLFMDLNHASDVRRQTSQRNDFHPRKKKEPPAPAPALHRHSRHPDEEYTVRKAQRAFQLLCLPLHQIEDESPDECETGHEDDASDELEDRSTSVHISTSRLERFQYELDALRELVSTQDQMLRDLEPTIERRVQARVAAALVDHETQVNHDQRVTPSKRSSFRRSLERLSLKQQHQRRRRDSSRRSSSGFSVLSSDSTVHLSDEELSCGDDHHPDSSDDAFDKSLITTRRSHSRKKGQKRMFRPPRSSSSSNEAAEETKDENTAKRLKQSVETLKGFLAEQNDQLDQAKTLINRAIVERDEALSFAAEAYALSRYLDESVIQNASIQRSDGS